MQMSINLFLVNNIGSSHEGINVIQSRAHGPATLGDKKLIDFNEQINLKVIGGRLETPWLVERVDFHTAKLFRKGFHG